MLLNNQQVVDKVSKMTLDIPKDTEIIGWKVGTETRIEIMLLETKVGYDEMSNNIMYKKEKLHDIVYEAKQDNLIAIQIIETPAENYYIQIDYYDYHTVQEHVRTLLDVCNERLYRTGQAADFWAGELFDYHIFGIGLE